MLKATQVVLGLVLVIVLAFAPLAKVGGVTAQAPEPPVRSIPIPQDKLDQFERMPIEELLVNLQGPIPHALEAYADQLVTVIVQFEGPALAEQLLQEGPMTAKDQNNYASALRSQQAAVVSRVGRVGGMVVDQFTNVYNGAQVRVPAKELPGLRAMSGVKAVHPVRTYRPALSHSTDVINAIDVWDVSGGGYTGTGINIAIIDTGIDYTHAAFGGTGTTAAYTSNDPDIIEVVDSSPTFPTLKVIGGRDFAGSNYDASSNDPSQYNAQADDDPLDENGHGTHVASTAAGLQSGLVGKGVAYDANLYALKVFGRSGSTDLVVSALEWCFNKNNNADPADDVHVINLSLGSDFGPADPGDPEQVAIENLTALQNTIVVAASGNAGNIEYITSSPAAADSAISVAATTSGFLTAPMLQVGLFSAPYAESAISGAEVTSQFSGPLAYVGFLSGASNDLLCSTTGIPAGALTGKIALIQRGTCYYSEKISNAKSLGAAGVIVFNNVSGGALATMGGDPVDNIPALFIRDSDGLILKENYEGQNVTVFIDQFTSISIGPDDAMATFSGRGPRGFDSFLKPEISAPGTNIFAAKVGSGDLGMTLDGTSMATPHVAGVAALIRQAHPTWTPEQVKAALMNTAVNAGHDVPLMGAGRVDALRAVNTTAVVVGDPDLVSLSWGVIEFNTPTFTDTKPVSVRNFAAAGKTYNISKTWGITSETAGATITVPNTVTVGADGTASFNVSLDLNASLVNQVTGWGYLEEYFGFIRLENQSDSSDVLVVPFYFLPMPYNTIATTGLAVNHATATGTFDHAGPISSDLEIWPVYTYDIEDATVSDNADLRMVMMDYIPYVDEDYIVFGFNLHGSLHNPQPYFAEIDLYIDVDQDGSDDYVIFNFNEGWLWGANDNYWVPVMVSLNEGWYDYGSDYYIWTDFNTGTMFWHLPASWYGLGPDSSKFDFWTLSFDFAGQVDFGSFQSVDYRDFPFFYSLGQSRPLGHQDVSIDIWANSVSGYQYNQPLGAALFDYMGQAGAGQVTFLPFEFDFYETYAPLIMR